MFSKTFFSRLKHANDVTILTGAGLVRFVNYPEISNFDCRNIMTADRASFLSDSTAKSAIEAWFPSAKATLGHYALIDIAKKLSNLHIMTTNADDLHTKASSTNVMNLSGTFGNIDSLRFSGEAVESKTMERANEVSAICEVFILCGVEILDDKVESLPFMAKGNGCYMAEISEKETDMTRHCNEVLHGEVADSLTKLSMIINKVF